MSGLIGGHHPRHGSITASVSAPPDGRSGGVSTIPASQDAPEDVETLIAELRDAARQAGIQRGDPTMPLFTALAHHIRFLANRTAASDRIAKDSSGQIINAIQQSRQTADAEIARFQAGIAQAEAITVRRIADSIAESADKALTRRITILQWSRVAQAALILVILTVGCLFGGYWWGRNTTLSNIHETEAGLQVAFDGGADAAQAWLNLMQWNNITTALSQCTGSLVFSELGRKACNVPLWIEPAKPDSSPLTQ